MNDTPPAFWDQWAMERAAHFMLKPFHDRSQRQNALHVLLIEAMRFASNTKAAPIVQTDIDWAADKPMSSTGT